MRLRWSFRSPYVPCFSVATEPVNVPGRFTATALATRAPGQENRRWRGPFALCRLPSDRFSTLTFSSIRFALIKNTFAANQSLSDQH